MSDVENNVGTQRLTVLLRWFLISRIFKFKFFTWLNKILRRHTILFLKLKYKLLSEYSIFTLHYEYYNTILCDTNRTLYFRAHFTI